MRLILIDPKRVELTSYENVPHLITPVVTHPKRASEALAWAVREMELRLETLAIAGVRNIAAYNKGAKEGTLPPLPSAGLDDEGRPDGTQQRPTLPYIVVVIDELSDLMMVAPATSRTPSAASPRWPGRSASTWWWPPSGRRWTWSPG